ncbi:hypothetical protein BLS_004988 [Venturia inaequalis]|uniref:Uncharacterized protein n=1 Tax=Venturia inaequalis TaxID=5025 RepID=A0A8H3YSG0_VENIN|nr:hypothetical protein BLS_004988 [Venturia inaequalis]KAE9984998.1 hypothetical protein EG328_007988 [Venturia inaequalis]KAE9985537.1 hypothetical protein EG327_004652 [Venturia inaequalis]RDI86470.1 hypothetical protein Vi05172_g3650 [Venturia inaequalis]
MPPLLEAWTAIGKDVSFLIPNFDIKPNKKIVDQITNNETADANHDQPHNETAAASPAAIDVPTTSLHPYTAFHPRAVQQALAGMSPYELVMWTAFISPSPKNGHVTYEDLLEKAPVDFDNDVDAAPTSKLPLRAARRRAEALCYLYQTDRATAGCAVWYSKEYRDERACWVWLVKAVARVIGAERDMGLRK